MVSFSCEACGDVLTKKKVDPHRGQCRGASFTCLDCMTHFGGTEYRAHTSCISEAQKYEGALYKAKPTKPLRSSRKSVSIADSKSIIPRRAYVEDAPDTDTGYALAIVDPPPAAPTPPPAVPARPVSQNINVFDFLVNDTPNASKVSLGGSKEQMRMVDHAPPLFETNTQSMSEAEDKGPPSDYSDQYHSAGYTYGTDPIPSSAKALNYQTPAPKPQTYQNGNASTTSLYELDAPTISKSTSQKRKRHHVEELDLSAAIRSSQEPDHEMLDADDDSSERPILHSGLTGGLNRLLSKSRFSPGPDHRATNGHEILTISPLKRTTQISSKEHDRDKAKERGRPSSKLVKVRKTITATSRRLSDESRPRKHHRSHHHPIEEPKRKLKAIEYPTSHQEEEQQLTLYRSRAEHFLSFVTKGEDSGGCSINKALKRWHRERYERGIGTGEGKWDEEKGLWKALRLRRNERGEIVVFF